MSLKTLHVVFVTASVLLAVFFSVWAFANYFGAEGPRAKSDLIYGIASVAATLALLVYGGYFLKKFKKVSYL